MGKNSLENLTTADEDWDAARNDVLANIILAALHKQDGRTFNGNAGNIGKLALDTAAQIRDQIVSLDDY